VLLDLSVAFDTVNHEILLSVLSDCFSISGTAFNWFQSYLSEWTQSFVYAGHASHATDCFPITCNIPQESIFGPVGFIAFIEDFTVVSKKHIVHSHMCADNTQLYYSSSKLANAESVQDHLTSCVLCC